MDRDTMQPVLSMERFKLEQKEKKERSKNGTEDLRAFKSGIS